MGKLWDCSAPSWAELQPSGSTPLPFSTRETEARTERVAAQVTGLRLPGQGSVLQANSLRKAGGNRPAPAPRGPGVRTSKPLPARGFEIPG